MTIMYERSAAAPTHGTPPRATEWLDRRVHSIKSHQENVSTIAGVFSKLGATMLSGKIATDVRVSKMADVSGTRPGRPVAETTFAIQPSWRIKRWGTAGLWSPDTATLVDLTFRDHYDDPHGPKPQPTGDVSLTLHARTWVKAPYNGALVEQSGLGWHRPGAGVSVTRHAGEAFDEAEVAALLEPFVGNAADYYRTMGWQPDRRTDEPGDYSGGPNHPNLTEIQVARAAEIASIGLPHFVEL